MRVRCPSCRKAIEWDAANSWRPFCSERCKLIDLGAWISEEHVIPGDAATDLGAEPEADPDGRRH